MGAGGRGGGQRTGRWARAGRGARAIPSSPCAGPWRGTAAPIDLCVPGSGSEPPHGPSALRRRPEVPERRARSRGPGPGGPRGASPRLSHNRWKRARERGRAGGGNGETAAAPLPPAELNGGNRTPRTKRPAGKSSARCDGQAPPSPGTPSLPRSPRARLTLGSPGTMLV